MTSLFQLGQFTLNSGASSSWKLECDALTDDDWRALAEMVRLMVGQFNSVEGVPRGGLKLAEYLRPHVSPSGPHLIVDDVLTTGGSMERVCETYLKGKVASLEGPLVRGAVIFARGRCPLWIHSVLQMPECFWLKPKTSGA